MISSKSGSSEIDPKILSHLVNQIDTKTHLEEAKRGLGESMPPVHISSQSECKSLSLPNSPSSGGKQVRLTHKQLVQLFSETNNYVLECWIKEGKVELKENSKQMKNSNDTCISSSSPSLSVESDRTQSQGHDGREIASLSSSPSSDLNVNRNQPTHNLNSINSPLTPHNFHEIIVSKNYNPSSDFNVSHSTDPKSFASSLSSASERTSPSSHLPHSKNVHRGEGGDKGGEKKSSSTTKRKDSQMMLDASKRSRQSLKKEKKQLEEENQHLKDSIQAINHSMRKTIYWFIFTWILFLAVITFLCLAVDDLRTQLQNKQYELEFIGKSIPGRVTVTTFARMENFFGSLYSRWKEGPTVDELKSWTLSFFSRIDKD